MRALSAGAAAAAKPRVRRQSFVKGALVLAVGGFIGKLIGAIYRIPLTNIIGAEGMGLYQMIFPMYSLLLTISSGGIPTALSRLVAEKCALKRYEDAGRLARNATLSLTVFGLVCSGLVAIFARMIAAAQGNAEATLSYYAIAPAIAFVAVISAVRGYFQGRENMVPSALSQILEQVAKLGFGLGLAVLLLPHGIAYAAAGATLGVSLSEAVAMIVLLVQRAGEKEKLPVRKERLFLRDCKELYRLAIPVTLGGIVMPLTQLIDSALVINILKKTMDVSTATALYGLSGGPVGSLINMPVVISLAIATAILPSVSASHAIGDVEGTRKKAGLAVRLCVLVALPCTAMFALFARPIIMLLYGGGLTVGVIDEPRIASELLALTAISVLLIAVIQVATNILHAIGRNYTPVVNLAIGAGAKIVLNLVLLPRIGIYAVAASSVACYLTACILDVVMLVVRCRPRFPFLRAFVVPVVSTGITAGIGYGLYRLISPWSGAAGLILAVTVGAAVYLLAAMCLGAVTEEERKHIPFVGRFTGFRSKRPPRA